MLVTLLSWIYMFLLCLTAGLGLRRAAYRCGLLQKTAAGGITAAVVAGIAGITVYAEYFSIFYRVGILAHLLMLAVLLFTGWKCRQELAGIFTALKKRLLSAEGPLLVLLVLVTAFYTSRGTFHTDTGIYHAQAIRVIEEYGLVRGIGNLQLHFAYNSSSLVFAALFTMSRILPEALHTTTGFLAVLLVCYAVHGLLHIREHRRHGADAVRLAILIYYLTNVTGSVSPATDYSTMYMILFLLCAWMELTEGEVSYDMPSASVLRYGMLSVLAVFTVSMKLSAASLVILAFYPAAVLIRNRQGKKAALFTAVGFFSFLPYMIRNVLISGWLFYPVKAIDLFSVKWKIPVAYLEKDEGQIKAWGRCLYDVTRLDEPLREWGPVWWAGQQHYEQMLVLAQGLAAILLAALIIDILVKQGRARRSPDPQIRRQGKLQPAKAVFYLAILAGLVLWFFTAPFIRYGLAFLLVFPLCTAADTVCRLKEQGSSGSAGWSWKTLDRTFAGLILLLLFLCFAGWFDNYAEDDLVFVKHEIRSPYYVLQEPFEDAETGSEELNGNTVYYSEGGEINSYYHCPSTCYKFMLDRTELIGDTIREGFMAK
jgi:hypothetical protein